MSSLNTDKIHIISLDLDGTLLNNRKQISTYSENVLNALQDKGYIIVLNSGRFYHEMTSYAKQLNLELHGGYLCCSNGYIVHDLKNNTHHEFTSINSSQAQEILQIAHQGKLLSYLRFNDLYHLIAPSFISYLNSICRFFVRLFNPFLPEKVRHLTHRVIHLKICNYHEKLTYTSLEKICFIALPFQLKRFKKDICKIRNDVQFFEVNTFSHELVKKGVSKADSLTYICSLHGYTLDNVIAFGDSGNDISIISTAGIGVRMKNSKSILDAHGSHISEFNNHQDGVAKFLEQHFLKN